MRPAPITLADIPRKKYRSQIEADFNLHLWQQAEKGGYSWYAYEALKFKIGDNLWYWPDFVAQSTNGTLIAFEVKGPYSRYAGEVKFKAAVERYPKISWIWVTRDEIGKWLFSRAPLPRKKNKL